MKRRATAELADDESITSISSESDDEGQVEDEEDEVDVNRLRVERARKLVEAYEQSVRGSGSRFADDDGDDEEEEESGGGIAGVGAADVKDAVADKLRSHLMERRGTLFRPMADAIEAAPVLDSDVTHLKGHKLAVTCVAVTHDESAVFSGGKDGAVMRWDLETGKRTNFGGNATLGRRAKAVKARQRSTAPSTASAGHTEQVLSIDVSSDGRYVASGGRDKVIKVWDARTAEVVHTFQGHTDAVTGTVFRQDTHLLFSCSADRTVKQWDLDEMTYVESFFGHSREVHGVSCLNRERLVSCGRDRKLLLWKLAEDTHLEISSSAAAMSLDCVSMINDAWSVAGAQNGTLSLFNSSRKKPVYVVDAHKQTPVASPWVTSVAALPNSDVVASGGSDGSLRLWRLNLPATGHRGSLTPLPSVPMVGCVNALAFAPSGRFLVAGVGQDPRLGRWWKVGGSKNTVSFVPLPSDDDRRGDSSEEEEDDSEDGAGAGAGAGAGGSSDSD